MSRISKVWTCSIQDIESSRGWSSLLNVQGKVGSDFDMPRQHCRRTARDFRSSRVTSLNNHFRFVLAHRALCAAAILARPSALIFLRGLDLAGVVDPNGRPRFAGVGVRPFNRVRTCSRRAISACILSMISLVVMISPSAIIDV